MDSTCTVTVVFGFYMALLDIDVNDKNRDLQRRVLSNS